MAVPTGHFTTSSTDDAAAATTNTATTTVGATNAGCQAIIQNSYNVQLSSLTDQQAQHKSQFTYARVNFTDFEHNLTSVLIFDRNTEDL